MKADDKKLKPCPFCGGIAHFYDDPDGSDNYYVGCEDCECDTIWTSPAALLKIWNKRTDGGKTK